MSNFTPYSKFYLIKDVDIDISYNHEYYFETEEEQRTFFQSKIFKTVENGTYQRKNSNTIAVPFLADEIRECKYVMWKNDVGNKWWYAFVTSVNYVNPSVSNITYQLDVYQSYLFGMEWKESFVERKHCKQYDNYNLPILNDAPETIDYGNSYRTLKKINLVQIPDVSFAIFAFSEGIDEYYDVAIEAQDVQGMPTGLWYYVVPIYVGTELNTNILFNKGSEGLVELTTAKALLTRAMSNSDLVGKLVSCVIMPFLTLGDISYTYVTDSDGQRKVAVKCDNLEHIKGRSGLGSLSLLRVKQGLGRKLYPYNFKNYGNIKDFYEHCNYSESKLYMYPYSFTELTTERGDTFIIKNEYIHGNDGNVLIQVYGSINFQNKMSFIVRDYLGSGDYLEHGIHDDSNANMPIIDDYTASYIQSNSNSVRVARSNALNTYSTELVNNQRTLTTNLNNASRTYQSDSWGNIAQSGLGFIGNAINGNIGGMLGNVGNAVSSQLSTWSENENTIDKSNTNSLNANATALTDYNNSIASVMAKYQDAEQMPATVRSMGGDYLFNCSYYTDGIYLLEKSILPEAANRLENYFKYYGYAYNKVEMPEFHTRQYWNYVKYTQPNVTGNIPMDDLLAIKGIFQNGITLWHGDYIGNYSLDNKEVS